MKTAPFFAGDRIELVLMGLDSKGNPDPDPIPAGSRGTVRDCQWFGGLRERTWQVSVDWDSGRSLSLILPTDEAVKLEPKGEKP